MLLDRSSETVALFTAGHRFTGTLQAIYERYFEFLTSTFSGWAISASFSINAWRASLTRYSCLVYWLLASLMLIRIASQFLRKRARRFPKETPAHKALIPDSFKPSKCAINTLGISSQYKKMITIDTCIHTRKRSKTCAETGRHQYCFRAIGRLRR